ncbi:hypothetical protein ACROYT_G005412 [Oculina patagonica]
MSGMARVTVFVMLLHFIGQNCSKGVKIGRKKIEVIHKGKPLQDLVILDSRVAPHDLDNLNAFVKPKLLEDSRDEGMMLQENGIEDFHPLDVSLDTEDDPYEGEKYKNGIDQISVSDSNQKDGGYGLRDMPEYNVETKADFKGNQEAIDWLMKDPNDFNVKSFEDSSVLGDKESFSQNSYSTYKENQDETEEKAQTNFHHRNEGSKRHHDSSIEDSTPFGHGSNLHSVQDYNQDEDDISNHINAESNTRLAKTTKWGDKYDDFQDSDYSDNDNIGQRQKSWESISDGVDDGTTDRSYNEYDKDTQDYDEQRPRVSSMKNLNKRIQSQDAKLYKELENFAKTDNYENIDDTDNLGNFDDQSSDFETLGRKYEDPEDREEELDSNGEDNNSMLKGKNSDRGRNVEWKGGESTHTNDQSDTENSDTDINNEVYSDGSGTVFDKLDNKFAQNDMADEAEDNDKEKSNSKSINSPDPEIVSSKTNPANTKEKLKELKNDKTHNTGNKHVNQKTDSLTNDLKNIDKSQDERIFNKAKDTQTISSNEKEVLDNSKTVHGRVQGTVQGTTINFKNENENHVPTDGVVNDAIITIASSKVEGVNKHGNGETKVTQHSDSGTERVPVTVSKVFDEIGKGTSKNTGEETLFPEDKLISRGTNGKKLMRQNVKDAREQKPDTKLSAAIEKPKLSQKIKMLHNGQAHNYKNHNKKPTSTGFRRNQQSNDPLSSIYSLADLTKIENIISYLRGTGTPKSVPTRSSRFTPTSVSLKNLYYYPLHPTPQEQNDDIPGVKDGTFSEWNDWSSCSVTCGKGSSVRARICLVTTCSQKDLVQTKSCRKPVCADEVARESLEEHNKLRARHFSPPLSWSAPLARKAQKIAQSLAAKDFLTLDDLREPQGESVAQTLYTGESTAKKAIEKWYSEIQSYSFSYPKINDKTRHFVQIVWKGTRKMGLAVAKSASGEYAFVVALYDPPISSEGHLRQNILRPGLKHDLYATFRRKRLAKVK